MALRKLVKRNYDGKSPVSIKYQNLHSLKKGRFFYVRVSLKREYHIYMAQLLKGRLNKTNMEKVG